MTRNTCQFSSSVRLKHCNGAESASTDKLVELSADKIVPICHVRIPHGTATINVGYVDVGPKDGPVILIIHGAIGGIRDFTSLFEPLTRASNRVLLPEFPGFGNNTTLEGDAVFDESTNARAGLVHNFLKALDIKRITTVIGHSMGSVSAFYLAANTDMFESIVYLNGIGLTPHKSLRPYWLVRFFARLLEFSLTKYIISSLLLYGYRFMGFIMDEDKGLVSATLGASRIGFDQFRMNVERVREKRLPILFAFTQNDKLVEWQLPLALAKHCNLSDSNIMWLASDKELNILDNHQSYPRALIFERGGHFVHRSRTEIISQSILQLVDFILRKSP